MRVGVLLVAAGLSVSSGSFAARAWGQEKQGKDKAMGSGMPDAQQMDEMMKKWQAVASPGEHHKRLQHFVGSWKLSTRMWMSGPGSEPTVSQGTATVKWVLDGRFLLEESSGEFKMPGPDGKEMAVPFKGLGLGGYDNYRNLYVGTWADNLNTHLLTMAGTCDPSGKVFTSYAQMDEPMLDVHGRMVKYVTRIINDNKHVVEIYDLHAGDNYKVLEITYERQ